MLFAFRVGETREMNDDSGANQQPARTRTAASCISILIRWWCVARWLLLLLLLLLLALKRENGGQSSFSPTARRCSKAMGVWDPGAARMDYVLLICIDTNR